MPLNCGANIRALHYICDVTSQGCVVRAHSEETPRPHEAVSVATSAQHTSCTDSVSISDGAGRLASNNGKGAIKGVVG